MGTERLLPSWSGKEGQLLNNNSSFSAPAEEAHIYGDANSYSYDAMRRAMALDKELSKFRLVPKRQCETETDLSAAIMASGATPTIQ